MNHHRTIIIGLDGATFDLIKPMIQGGYLPTFAKLIAEGTHGPLLAWPNMNSAAAWTSMVTGYNPGEHGVYDFGDAPPQRGQTWHPTTAKDRQKDPFWRLLSAAGQQVGVINMPITYPVDRINGFMLAGMDTPNLHSPGFAHPPDLPDELRRQGIDYIIDVPKLGELTRRNPLRAIEEVRRMVEARARTMFHLMDTRPWDALMAVFVAPDRVQHAAWPADNSSVDSADWLPIRSLYQQIDSILADVLKRLDDDTTLLLVSDHGFTSSRAATWMLNQLFAKLGLLSYHPATGQLKSKLLANLLIYGRKVIPRSLQRPLARMFPKLHLRSGMERLFSGIDWSRTQAFVLPLYYGVCINLKGREPEGTVPPQDYDSFRERVRETLLRLTDPVSQRPLMKAVYRREALYHGPQSGRAPDLILEWDHEATADSICYSDGQEPIIVARPEQRGAGSQWRGTHHPEGIFLAFGSHIKRGATVTNAVIYDIAPTVLYLQGHPVPTDMDGHVLTDIFTDEQLRLRPVEQGDAARVDVERAAPDLTAEEEQEIEERLRGLGYIE
jgi:predicted AlkP superfamily phosphohydrolase/phosphomutase